MTFPIARPERVERNESGSMTSPLLFSPIAAAKPASIEGVKEEIGLRAPAAAAAAAGIFGGGESGRGMEKMRGRGMGGKVNFDRGVFLSISRFSGD